jgi:hypothetical protein
VPPDATRLHGENAAREGNQGLFPKDPHACARGKPQLARFCYDLVRAREPRATRRRSLRGLHARARARLAMRSQSSPTRPAKSSRRIGLEAWEQRRKERIVSQAPSARSLTTPARFHDATRCFSGGLTVERGKTPLRDWNCCTFHISPNWLS